MRKQTEDFIRKQALFEPGSQILVAVSGGADSVCLLYLLCQIREEWDLELRGFHIHHGLRGQEADRDERFAANLCKSLQVPYGFRHVDVKTLVQETGLSCEEAARNLRYQVLEEEAKKWEMESGRPVKIAVAHHGDDNAETILHNLFRGSGLKGLGGIPPIRGRIIRPLLGTGRKEILNYIEAEGVSYCQDSTNQLEAYTRNRLRHNIIPLICSQVNERGLEHILQAAKRISQADVYLEGQADLWLKQYGVAEPKQEEPSQRAGADKHMLLKEPVIIQTYVIRQMIRKLSGSGKDITSIHVESVRELLEKQPGKQADLPYNLTARGTYDYLWIERRKYGEPRQNKVFGKAGGEANIKKSQAPNAEFQLFSYEKGMEIPQNRYTKWFDYDTIKDTLSVRTRQAGDYFILPGGGRKTIKSYFIDEKVPASQRDSVYLLADGGHILWIIGMRISEGCKVTAKTKKILQVHISGGNEDGR